MRKKVISIFAGMFLGAALLLIPCFAAEPADTETPDDMSWIEMLVPVMENMRQDPGNCTITCRITEENADQKMQNVCDRILEKLKDACPDMTFVPAEYILGYDGYYTMYWKTEMESYIVSCTLIPGEETARWEITCRNGESPKADQMGFPLDLSYLFELDYGMTEQEVMEQISQYLYHYDLQKTDPHTEEGCFTVYPASDGPVEYIQLHTISFDTMQYLEQYAEDNFAFPTDRQLARVEYHLKPEYDSYVCIDKLIPELTEKWSDHKRLEDWTYSRNTDVVMKESDLLNSRFWKECGSFYQDYDSVGVYVDKETDHFYVQYDGRKALILQILNTWTLKE